MIRDAVRALLVAIVMAVGAAIVVEARARLAAIDLAHQAAAMAASRHHFPPAVWQPAPIPPPSEGGVRRVGRAAVDMADAVLNLVR